MRALLLSLVALAACAGPQPEQTIAAERPELRQLVEQEVASGFSGAVLVAEGRRLLLFDGFGELAGAPIKPDSRFWIASSGKQFTSAAIMRLVDDGKMSLDNPLSDFIPTAPADKAGITVRQLLSHTSGLAQAYVSENQTSRETAVGLMLNEPLDGPPGERFRYSNSNIQLAAAIVEIVSAVSYGEFVKDRLWDAAGLTNTGFAGPAATPTVSPIEGDLPERLTNSYWGEQGVYSTAEDLFRWYRSLRRGAVISRKSVRTLFEPVAEIGEGHAALGWFLGVSPRGQTRIFTRGNEDFGANSLIYAYPDSDVIIIVLTHAGDANEDASWSRKIHGEIETLLDL